MSYLAYVIICCAVTYLLLLGVGAFTRPAGTARFLGAFAQTLPAHFLELALRVAVGAALIIRSPAMHFAQGVAVFGWILVGTSVLIALMPWRLHQRFARWSVPLATRRMRFLGVGATVAGLVVLYALVAPKAGSEANEAQEQVSGLDG